MKYVYPIIITPLAEPEGGFDVYVPDLPGCRTCGDTLLETLEMAEDAVSTWLREAENENMDIPAPSTTLAHEPTQFFSLIKADTDFNGQVSEKKTISA